MLTKARILVVIGAVAALLVALAVQPEPASARGERPIRIGFPPWIGYDVIVYADRAGLFEKHGLDVELIRFDETSDVARALMEGSLEFGFTGLGTVVCNHDGTPLDVVLITNISNGADGIVAAPGIDNVRDLRGRVVACKMHAINRLILAEALEHHGMSIDDISVVDLCNTAATERVVAGEVEAAILWDPSLSAVAEQIGGGVIHRTSDLDSLVIDSLFTRSDFASSNADEVRRVREAWFDLIAAIESDPDAVFAVCSEVLRQQPEDFARSWGGIRPGDRAVNERILGDGFDELLADIARMLDLPVPAPVGVFRPLSEGAA